MAWEPSRDAFDLSTRLYSTDLKPPSLEGFVLGIDRGEKAPLEGDLYDDALNDLARLLEEYRFEVATAALYLESLRSDLEALAEQQRQGPFSHLGITPKAVAFLSNDIATHTPPAFLLEQPEIRITATRLLGGWWAAQLIDSALLRGLSSLDRVATMLALRDGATFEGKWLPSFRPDSMKKIRRWRGETGWLRLRELLRDPLFEYVKQYRDGFIHRRREPIELHGEHVAIWRGEDGQPGVYRGMTPDMHLGLGVEFFRQVLHPAIESGASLIAGISPPLE